MIRRPIHDSHNSEPVPRWPLLLGLVCIVLSVVLDLIFEYHEHDIPLLNTFVRHLISAFIAEIGIAFLIAWIISIIIEKRSDAAHAARYQLEIDEIKFNVLEALYKRQVPHEFFDYIEENVLRPIFYRREWDVTYDIRVSARDKAYFDVKVDMHYEVENLSDHNGAYIVTSWIDKTFLFESENYITDYKLFIDGQLIVMDHIEQEDISPKFGCSQKKLTHKINIKGSDTKKIKISYNILKHQSDYLFLRSITASDGVRLKIIMDRGFYIFVRSVHPSELRMITGSKGDRFYEWEIDRPLTPHQGILIWWIPRPMEKQTSS